MLENEPYSNEFFSYIEILQPKKIGYQNCFKFIDYSFFNKDNYSARSNHEAQTRILKTILD